MLFIFEPNSVGHVSTKYRRRNQDMNINIIDVVKKKIIILPMTGLGSVSNLIQDNSTFYDRDNFFEKYFFFSLIKNCLIGNNGIDFSKTVIFHILKIYFDH